MATVDRKSGARRMARIVEFYLEAAAPETCRSRNLVPTCRSKPADTSRDLQNTFRVGPRGHQVLVEHLDLVLLKVMCFLMVQSPSLGNPYGSTYLLRRYLDPPGAYINSLQSPYLRRYVDP